MNDRVQYWLTVSIVSFAATFEEEPLGFLIATPLSWWMMNTWLGNFMYQVGIHPLIFVLSGLALILISWITLSYLSFKTSKINPVDTLRASELNIVGSKAVFEALKPMKTIRF